MRVLVVEDEPALRTSIAQALAEAGYAVDTAASGQEALHLGSVEPYDALVLDLGLPVIDGLTVLRRWRAGGITTPVLILTARDLWHEKVAGIDAGADDYLTKPFGVRELMARVRALLRRAPLGAAGAAASDGSRPVTYRHIQVDPARRRVRVGDRDVDLTAHEFQLLHVLLSSPGIVFTRESLLARVWKDDTHVTVRSVDTLIKRLRRKIEEVPGEPTVIQTVWGAGYKAADV